MQQLVPVLCLLVSKFMPKVIAVLGPRRLVNSELALVFGHNGCRVRQPFFFEAVKGIEP